MLFRAPVLEQGVLGSKSNCGNLAPVYKPKTPQLFTPAEFPHYTERPFWVGLLAAQMTETLRAQQKLG